LKVTLVTGGARSGKSTYAQETAMKAGMPVLFVATAEAGDEDMRKRIEAHRNSRPVEWSTLEATSHIGSRIIKNIGKAKLVIVDCITLLVNNIFMQYDETTGTDIAEKGVMAEIKELIDCVDRVEADFIIVTNETGLGIVPADRVSRLYRDILGRANQRLAQRADEVYMLIAGIPLAVKTTY
jgi:adenosylcobinamide kinase/adenosylcobinamide-phosphate guanylyltransferase